VSLAELEAVFVRYIPRPPTDEERVLNPQWPTDHVVDCFQIEGVSAADAHGLLFVCPKSKTEGKDHYIQVYFAGSPVPDRLGKNKKGETVRWTASWLTGLNDLSLSPSIQEENECGWHGHVTLGSAT
jgi:hypothetical protein